MRSGGLGIQDPVHTHCAAVLASTFNYARSLDNPREFLLGSSDAQEALQELSAKYAIHVTQLAGLYSVSSDSGPAVNPLPLMPLVQSAQDTNFNTAEIAATRVENLSLASAAAASVDSMLVDTHRPSSSDTLPTPQADTEREARGNTQLPTPAPSNPRGLRVERQWRSQSWWSQKIQEARIQQWQAASPLRVCKLRQLAAARHAADGLATLCPPDGEQGLESEAWLRYLRFRLGLPLTSDPSPTCPGCSKVMDAFGDHALSCKSLGVYGRHNSVRDALATLLRSLGFQVTTKNIKPDAPQDVTLFPGDLLVHGLPGVQPTAVDIGVTHPLQLSSPLAEVSPGKAAVDYERRKIFKNLAFCRKAGWTYCPFVLETVGAWSGRAKQLMQMIITQWASQRGSSYADAAQHCRSSISGTLLAAVARQLASPALSVGLGCQQPA